MAAAARSRHALTRRAALIVRLREPPSRAVGSRRIEENGLSEACAPWHEDVGFMAYNTLAGGMLTGTPARTRTTRARTRAACAPSVLSAGGGRS